MARSIPLLVGLLGLCVCLPVLTAQSVVTTNPSPNDESVPRNANLSATFSTNMQGASSADFVVRGRQRGTRTGGYSGGGSSSLIFNPDVDLTPNEEVFVTLTTSLQSTGGQPLASPYVYRVRGEAGWGPRDFSAFSQDLGFYNSEIARTGDMNGDGHIDIVLGSAGAANAVMLNDGFGNFLWTGSVIQFGAANGLTYGLDLGDVDNDGDLDVLASDSTQNRWIFINDGTGTLTGSNLPGSATGSTDDARLADFDGDGDLDAVIGGLFASGWGIWVYLNQGGGTFGNPTVYGSRNQFGLDVGDMDNDGDLDVATGWDFFFNDGTGSFPTIVGTGNANTGSDCHLADVDGDSDLDYIVAGGSGTFMTQVWKNNGSGNFTLFQSIGTTEDYSVGLGDIDGDGDLDMVRPRYSNSLDAQVFLNNGGGTFSYFADIPGTASNGVKSIAMADFDYDYDVDLVLARQATGNNCFVHLNTAGDAEVLLQNGPLAEPATIDSVAGSAAYTSVFDFQLQDQGSTAGQSTRLGRVVIHASGSADADDHQWRLVPQGYSSVPGTVGGAAGNRTITFDMNVNIANGGSLTFTLQVQLAVNPAGTADNEAFQLSLSTSDIKLFGGSQFQAGQPALNPAPLQYEVNATTLLVSSQPPATVAIGSGFPVAARYADSLGNTDLDVNGDVLTATRSDAGAVSAGQSSGAVQGVAIFAGANLVVLGAPPATGIHLVLTDDTGGSVDISGAPVNTSSFNVQDLPRLVGVTPAPNSFTAPTSSSISGAFDRNMNAPSTSTMRVQTAGRGVLSGTYSGGGSSSLVFTPGASLLAGEQLEVSFTAGLQSSGGRSLSNPTVARFRAAAGVGPAEFRKAVQNISVGTTCTLAMLADMDGDGDLDLLASTSAGQLETYENIGGTLNTTGVAYGATFAYTRRGCIGDFDLDSDVDVLLQVGTQMVIYSNNGSGVFTAGAQFGTTYGSAPIRTGDLDADGDLDILLNVASGVALYFNDGSGNFPGTGAINTGFGQDFEVGDIDGDGDLDVVFAVNGTNTLWFNNGAGNFTVSGTWGSSGNTQQIALGDADGDGDIDIVASNGASTDELWLNDGWGSFASGGSFGSASGLSSWLDFADFDGDGDLDVIDTRDAGTYANYIYLNDGSGDFSWAGAQLQLDTVSYATWNGAAGDLDGDGDIDFVTANGNNGLISQLNHYTRIDVVESPAAHMRNAGRTTDIQAQFWNTATGGSAGTFVPRGSLRGKLAGSYSGNGSATLVFDPAADLLPGESVEVTLTSGISVGGSAVPYPFVWQFRAAAGSGPGYFAANSLSATPGGDGRGIAVGDLDADGDMDIVVAHGSNAVYLLINDGANTFTTTQLPHSGTHYDVVLFDRDNDGDLDLATINTSGLVQVWTNIGGVFSATTSLSGGNRGLRSGDMNGDGWADLVTGRYVFLNNGSGGFSNGASVQYKATGNLGALAVSDVDKDGDLDIAGFDNSGNGYLYLNDWNGTFGQVQTLASASGTWWIEFGDMDGDGDEDLVAGGPTAGARVYRNNGGQLSTYTVISGTGSSTRQLTLADVDGDGDLDVAFSVSNSSNRLFLNNGAASFTAGTSFGPASQQAYGITATDFDGDGDLDLVTACTNGQGRIYFNNNPGQASVTASSPAQEAASGARNLNPTVVFSRDMGSASNSSVPGYSPFSGRLGGNYFTSGPNVSLNPNGIFANEEICLVVTTALQDAGGNALTSPWVLHYRTASYGLGDASFASPSNLGGATASTSCIAFGDVDLDGDLDAVVGCYGSANFLYYNDGSGSFGSPVQIGPGNDNTRALAMADINRDGRVDIIVGNDGQSVVYLNAVSNPFTSTINLGSAGSTAGLAVGDLDGNGSLDIVLADDGGQNRWFPNNWGTLNSPENFGSGSDASRAVTLADLDLDGDLDLLVANYNAANEYYLNNSGTLSAALSFSSSNPATRAVACADLNGDRFPDVVFGNDGQSEVFLNLSGTGFGSANAIGGAATNTAAVVLGDFDGDSSLDIAEGVEGGQDAVYLNNGNGSFGSAKDFGGATTATRGLAAVDLDGDDMLELVAGTWQQQDLIFSNDFVPSLDSDATLSASSALTEPTQIDSFSGALAWVNVLDFSIADGGTADGYPTVINQVVINESGSAQLDWADWRLNGPGVTNAGGVVIGNTVRFYGLTFSVDDGTSATFTVSMKLRSNIAMTDHAVWELSLDESDLTTVYPSTTFTAGTTVDNGNGLELLVAATQLRMLANPPIQVTAGFPFDVSVQYTDAWGNRDLDVSDTVTFVRSDGGTVSSTASTAAAAGVASFSSSGGNAVVLLGSAAGITLDFSDDAAGVTASAISSAVFDLVIGVEWTGATSTDWQDASNWNNATVPSSSSSITIPATATNMPQLSANGSCGDIRIEAGASLTLGSFQLSLYRSLIVEGTLIPGTGKLRMLSGSALISSSTVDLADLEVNNVVQLLADVTLVGNITGNGTINGQGSQIRFTGTAAQTSSSFVGLNTHLRNSNTSAVVTVARSLAFTKDYLLTVDTGAVLELTGGSVYFTYDTPTSTSPLSNSGLLVFSSSTVVDSADVDLGDVEVAAGGSLTLRDGWGSVNTGSLEIKFTASPLSYGSVSLGADSDFSGTTLTNNGWIRFTGFGTFDLVPPASGNIGNLELAPASGTSSVTVTAALLARSLSIGGGPTTSSILSGNVTLTGDLMGTQPGSFNGALIMAGSGTQTIGGPATGFTIDTMRVSAGAYVVLDGRLNLTSVQSGAGRALTVEAGGILELAPSSILELGQTAGVAEVRVEGELHTNAVAAQAVPLTRSTSVADRFVFIFAPTSELVLNGWHLNGLGDSSLPYGLSFESGATITRLDGLVIDDCEAATAMMRFDAINAAAAFSGMRISAAGGGNIDAANYAGASISLYSSSSGTGTRFGAAYENDPANRLDWFEVPYLVQGAPARGSWSAGANSDIGGDFSRPMAAPAAGEFMLHGSQSGRLSGTLSGAGTASLRLQPAANLFPGEELEVRFGQSMQDTAGVAMARSYVYRFNTSSVGGTGNFSPTADLTAAAGTSRGVVLGDLDRDGDLDIVNLKDWWGVAGPLRPSTYVNDGYGRFTWWHDVNLGDARNGVLADLNGDGWLDIAVIAVNRIRVVFNDGSGRLDQNPIDIGPATTGDDLQAGDFNADGYPDLVATFSSGSQNLVLLNDGTGAFPNTVQLGNSNARDIAIGDVDNDDDLDVITGEKLHLNDGSAAFVTANWITGYNYNPALADFDGDGDLDIATATYSGQDALYLNDGAGTFTAGANLGSAGFNSRHTLAGDLNGDGLPDVIVYSNNAGRVFLNQGNGAMSAAVSLNTGININELVLGDVDGDGDVDAVAAYTSGVPKLFFNDGLAPQSPLLTSSTPGQHAENASVAGNLSAVFDNPVGTPGTGGFRVHGGFTGWRTAGLSTPTADTMLLDPANNFRPGEQLLAVIPKGLGPTGRSSDRGWQWSFHAAPTVNTPDFSQTSVVLGAGTEDARAMAVGDFDMDGDLDVAVAISGAQNQLFYNNGAGAFPNSASIGNTTDDTRALIAFDIDGDGDLDLVEGNYGQPNNIYTNSGGTFSLAASFGAANDNTTGLAYADFDLDGDLDFAEANDGQQNRIYLNDGSGSFPTQLSIGGAATNTRFVTVGDVDGDYRPDVLFGNSGQDSPIYVHDAKGVLVAGFTLTAALYWGLLYDHNGDGDLDLWVRHATGTTLYEADGTGGFPSQSSGGSTVSGVFQGDVNGDGRLDWGVFRNGVNSISAGDNSPTPFTSQAWGPSATPFNTVGAAVADFNGDGKVDIIEITSSGEPTTIYFNQQPGAYPQATTPSNLSITVPGVQPKILFSQTMNQADSSKWPVYSSLRGKLAGTYGISSNLRELSFTPSSPLLPGERLDLSATTQLTRVGGTPVTRPVVWTLTVRTSPAVPDMNTLFSNIGGAAWATWAVAAADFDLDGDIDVALATDSTGDTVVFFNDGTGAFLASTTVSSGMNSRALCAADMDGDGDMDLVEGNFGQPNYVYLNTAGGFSAGLPFGTGTDNTAALAVGDIDGDGHLDVFAGNDGQQDTAYFGSGTGGFGASQNFGGPATATRAVAMMNPYTGSQQELPAIFVGDYGGQNVAWFPGATGYSAKLFGTGSDHTVGLALADVDGDQAVDVLVVNGNGEADTICLEGYPHYQAPQALNNAADSFAGLFADFDGDDRWDALVGRDAGNGSQLFEGDGQAGFSLHQAFANTSACSSLAAADFDGDGDLDLLLGTLGQTTVRLNGGTAPQLQSTDPALYERSASTAATITANFDRAMAAPTAGQMPVLGLRTGNVPGTRGAATNSVSFTPGANLPAGEMYQVLLASTLQDATGARFGGGYTWRFTTATAGSSGSFHGGKTVVGVPMTSTDLAVADLDGDGDLDILTYEGSVGGHVFLNQGSGTFTPGPQVSTGFRRVSNRVLLADLDGDGDLDLLPYASGGTTLLNSGSGAFSAGTNLPNGWALEVADLDNDGDVDLVWNNGATTPKIELLENDGAGNFSSIGLLQPPQGLAISSVFCEDFNQDGKLDLLAGTSLYVNDGGLRFVFSQSLGSGAIQVIADLDADNDLDVISGNIVNLFSGGVFTSGAYTNPFSASHEFCGSGDIDGDGDHDLLFHTSGGGYYFQRNDGGMSFTQLADLPGLSGVTTTGRLADFDGNGTLDFAAAAYNGAVHVVWQGDGPLVTGVQPPNGGVGAGAAAPAVTFDRAINTATAGANAMYAHGSLTGRRAGSLSFNAGNDEMTFTPTAALRPGETIELDVPAGLLDASGNPLARSYSWSFRVTPAAASGVFISSAAFGGADPTRCVAAGDIDGDGDIDVVSANFNAQDYLYLNNGAGTFTPVAFGSAATASVCLALGDMDGDGDLDVAVGRSGQPGELFMNVAGTLVSAASLPADLLGAVFADLTGDGLPDLVTTAGMMVNTGGSLGALQAWQLGGTVTGTAEAVTAADLNNDGSIDVALGWSGGNPAVRLLYNYNAALIHTYTIAAPSDVLDLEAADLDADGAVEVAAVLSGALVRIYGLGSQSLVGTPTDAGVSGENYTDLEIQDIDGDGDFDLLVSGQTSRVLRQGTTGAFAPAATLSPGGAESLCTADLDGDDRIDVVLARDGTPSAVFFNSAPSSGANDAVITVQGTPLATIDSVAGAAGSTAVMTFRVEDQGVGDSLPTEIVDLTVLLSGSGDASEHVWLLAGTGISPVLGTFAATPTPRLLFNGVGISISSGTSADYTIYLMLASNPAGTADRDTFVLTVDANETVFGLGSRFTGSVDNGSLEYSVTASGLRFATQPSGASAGTPFSLQPVLHATDTAGNLDLDASGSVDAMATSVAPGPVAPLLGALSRPLVAGEASFIDLQINVPGLQYVIRVQAGPLQAESASFDVAGSIGTAQPPLFYSLRVDDPDNAYHSGEQVTFTANLGVSGLSVTADLSVIDSTFGNSVVLTDNADGTYSLTTPVLSAGTLIEGANLAIAVTASDGVRSSTKPLLVTIDDTAPVATLSLNRPVLSVPAGVLRISLAANELLYGQPLITISGVSGAANVTSAAMAGVSPTSGWSFDYTLPAGASGTGTISISQAEDVAGNAASVGGVQQFTVTGGAAGLLADAGPDLAIQLPQRVFLDASATSGATGYNWTQLSGPVTVTIVNSTAATPHVDLIKSGTYSFQLDVTDGTATATDIVCITLWNSAPEIEAGRDHNITYTDVVAQGAQFFTVLPLEATIFDANGDNLVVRWDLLSAPPAGNIVIASPDSTISMLEVQGTTIEPGVYVIGLRVQDPTGLRTDTWVGDTIRIVVTSSNVVPPSAHSGFQIVVAVGVASELSGHESADPDAANPMAPGLSYFWSLERRPPGSGAVLVDSTQKKPHLTPDVPGVYLLSLVVVDVDGHVSGRDYVRVIANQTQGANANTIPRGVANYGYTDTDGNGALNVNEPVQLSSTSSIDGENDPISFVWRQIGGPALVFLPDPNAGTHDVQFNAAGVYGFRLEVRDTIDEGIPAEVWVRVADSGTQPPSAVAAIDSADDPDGDSYVLVIPGVGVDNNASNPDVNLSAAGSSVDASLTGEYLWAQTRGPTVALVGANTANLSFTPLISRVYEFELTLRDSNGVTDKLVVVVAIDTWHATINPGGNAVPRVTSAPPQSATAGATVVLTGSATDPNTGQTLSYIWEQLTGAPVVLDLTSPLAPSFTAPVTGTYAFRLYVDDGYDISPGFDVLVTAQSGTPAPGGSGGGDGGDDGGCALSHGSASVWWLLGLLVLLCVTLRLRAKVVWMPGQSKFPTHREN